ncbi:hypothetical protein E0H26_25385 [Micromonospora zingiberis]|uniref:Transcriptional regulator n=1 Tax=Micromonospora zingiberis TaxID=2053011 RepID=A0A4R0G730_9ACTN|nr:hypothetical protein [Micromonospora zingiberis]TCB91623.1 hypothetical protein E0H26_25385 [Micromonospora zingiberis]
MNLPSNVANPVLAVLIKGCGYPSLAQLATAINKHGSQRYGVETKYDHTSVKRWLQGGRCEHKDVVAEVLAAAWAVPIAPEIIWPGAREGSRPLPAHFHPGVAARTLEVLATAVVRDMLTSRDLLADSVDVAIGSAIVEPITRWLRAEPVRLAISDRRRPGRVNLAAVEEVERATRLLVATDARLGGSVCREAAIGELKYAVDLLRTADIDITTGNRLLSAIAKLAGEIGWMSHDAGLEGPAQQYFTLGLQAAHESTDQRAPFVAIGILADMARQMRKINQPESGLRFIDLGFEYLPEYARGGRVEAMLWNLKGRLLSVMGRARRNEVESAVCLSFEMFTQSNEVDSPPWQHEILNYIGIAEFQRHASGAYLALAAQDGGGDRFAAEAEKAALKALESWSPTFQREKAYSLIDLAHARFLLDRPDEACDDGEQAIRAAAHIIGSTHTSARLKELHVISDPFSSERRVKEFQGLLRAVD